MKERLFFTLTAVAIINTLYKHLVKKRKEDYKLEHDNHTSVEQCHNPNNFTNTTTVHQWHFEFNYEHTNVLTCNKLMYITEKHIISYLIPITKLFQTRKYKEV